jgi:hypothetical protein
VALLPVIKIMLKSMKISDEGVTRMLSPVPSQVGIDADNSWAVSLEFHKRQLHSGSFELETFIQSRVIPGIRHSLNLRLPEAKPFVLDRSKDKTTVSLMDLCVDLFITGTGDNFLGHDWYKSHPDFLNAYLIWERTNWKYMFQFPGFLSRDMLSARELMVDSLVQYLRIPRDKKNDASYFFKSTENMLRELGCSEQDMARMLLLHLWAYVIMPVILTLSLHTDICEAF